MHQSWSGFPPMRLSFGAKVEQMFISHSIFFLHRKEDLIPAPTMMVFPPMQLNFGAKVEQMFLHPFNISDIRKRIKYQHQ